MTMPWPTANLFQLGYVTKNLEQAMAVFRETQGLADYLTFDTRDFAVPGAPGPFIKVALAWRGSVMIELIEPVSPDAGIYTDALGRDGPATLHHLGYLVTPERLEGLAIEFRASGIAVPVERRSAGISFLYADLRDTLGHYCEFVCPSEEGQKMFDAIPRY